MFKKTVTRKQAQAEVNRFADRVSADDVGATVGNESKFRLLFRNVAVFAQYWEEVKLVFLMLRDFSAGRYTKCPWRTIAILVGALTYVLTPLDLIPDFLPAIGWSDDCVALAFALAFAKVELEAYKAWKGAEKKAQDGRPDNIDRCYRM